jgi:hypothetical protein
MEDYRGKVADAVIGRVPLRPGPSAASERWRELLERGIPIAVVSVLGPRPRELAPLLTIHGTDVSTGILLGVRGQDIVLRQLTRAQRWHLDAPDLQARGALAPFHAGDTVMIATVPTPAGQCFIVRREGHCGIGHTAGDGWRLLYSGAALSAGGGKALNALWAGLLVLPIGFWARRRTALILGLVVAWYGWVRVAADTVLLPAGWPEGIGVLLGLLAGMFLSVVAKRALHARVAP